MITAILYASNSGYTKQYAELLAQRTGLPAYNIRNSIPPALAGANVLFMGWMMAGNVQGYNKVRAKYNVKALCAVGMAPKEQDQTAGIRERLKLGDMPLFYLQGGFDINRLHGVYRFMMRVMIKKIKGDVEKLETRTPDQEAMYQMATQGMNCVSEANLTEVIDWCRAQ